MQPTLAASRGHRRTRRAPAEVQKILTELQEARPKEPAADHGPPGCSPSTTRNRADIAGAARGSSAKNNDDRNQWTRQMIDSIASAVQIGAFAEGLDRLKSLETALQRTAQVAVGPVSRLSPAARRIRHPASSDVRQPSSRKFKSGGGTSSRNSPRTSPPPKTRPRPCCSWPSPTNSSGRWPTRRSGTPIWPTAHPQTKAGNRRAGALRRLDLKGKPFEFTGPAARRQAPDQFPRPSGQGLVGGLLVHVVHVCTQDLPVLKDLDQCNPDRAWRSSA